MAHHLWAIQLYGPYLIPYMNHGFLPVVFVPHMIQVGCVCEYSRLDLLSAHICALDIDFETLFVICDD